MPNCRGSLNYFSGANTLDLEHYMKPSLKNNWPDAVVIHTGSNDVDFRNIRSETAVKDIAENFTKIALLCKEYGVSEVVVSSILPKRCIKLYNMIYVKRIIFTFYQMTVSVGILFVMMVYTLIKKVSIF